MLDEETIPDERRFAAASVLKPPATNVRWIVLAFVAFASASAYLTRFCVSAANTTIQKELGFDDEDIGAMMSAFSLGYLFFQVPGGWLGSRFGTRLAFALTSTFWSLCNVWTGVSSLFGTLLASRFSLGAFQAGLTPISATILKNWIPLKNLGMSSAAIGACMSVGGVATLGLTGWLLERDYGWREIFCGYSVVGIVWSAGFYWFFRTRPEEHAGVNEAELRLIRQRHETAAASPGNAAADDVVDERIGGDPAGEVMALVWNPSMWGLCSQSFFRSAGYAFFVTWFFAFLEYVYGIGKAEAGLLNSLPLLGVVAGATIGGAAVDALLRITGNKWISRSGTAIVALTLCGCFTTASAWASSAAGLSLVIAVGAFFSGIGSPASWAATIDLGGRRTGVVMGIANMAGCVAIVVLPYLLGSWFKAIRETGGDWGLVIYLHAAFYFAAAASWLIVNPNRRLFPGSR